MGPTVVLRSGSSRALGVVMVVVAVAGLASTVLAGPEAVGRYAGPLVLFGVLGWAAFWRPLVEVSDGGVRVVNTLRTTEVPWPALEEVEGRYGLRLVTAYGVVQAWGAQAPSGRSRARSQDSEAAVVVRERWEALRVAGHLDDRRLERPAPRVTWHRPVLAGLATGVVVTLAGLTGQLLG